MNILYIVGNGLDIQYGLKTKYSDFYEYQIPIYKERKNTENYFNIIYDNILMGENTNWENWSDLELALGELTKNPEVNEKEFMSALDDLNEDLNAYLRIEQDKFDLTGKTIDIQNYFDNFLKQIPEQHKDSIKKYFRDKTSSTDTLKILSFNYTNILDRLVKKINNKVFNSIRGNNVPCYIKDVEHAHGTLDFAQVLGLSDDSQLNKNYELNNRKYLIKELILEQVRENRNKNNVDLLNWADIIIIFGMSIGATDSYIWGRIAENSIKKNIPIILHSFVKNFENIKPHSRKLGILYESIESNFIEKTGIEDDSKIKTLKNNIVSIISEKVFEISEEKIK